MEPNEVYKIKQWKHKYKKQRKFETTRQCSHMQCSIIGMQRGSSLSNNGIKAICVSFLEHA